MLKQAVLCFVMLMASIAIAQDIDNLDGREKPKKVFDHSSTGFDLEGVHGTVSCSSCHINGVFKGTPRECSICHSRNGLVNAVEQSISHIPSTNNCEACHMPTIWEEMIRVDHTEVKGGCNSCHNRRIAQGKPLDHVPTIRQCDGCHSDVSWIPARFSHTNLTVPCLVCHNGSIATGKTPNHIPTTQNCGNCHTVDTWDITNFRHPGIADGCVTCHNGIFATGKHAEHIPAPDTCELCHTTESWTQ